MQLTNGGGRGRAAARAGSFSPSRSLSSRAWERSNPLSSSSATAFSSPRSDEPKAMCAFATEPSRGDR
jgi:hypothetical protein